MIFNPSDTPEHIAMNCGICFVVGGTGAFVTGGISPLAAAVCCLLQPLAFKVCDFVVKNFFNESQVALNAVQNRVIWGATLLIPSLICWQQDFSVNPFAAIILQFSAIGAVCVARNISVIK